MESEPISIKTDVDDVVPKWGDFNDGHHFQNQYYFDISTNHNIWILSILLPLYSFRKWTEIWP